MNIDNMTWIMLASCSAVFSAGAAIIQKKVLFRITALEFSFLMSIVVLFFSLFVLPFVDVTSIPVSTLTILIGKSILGGIAFLLVMMSLERNQISNALPLLGLTPALTALLALPILGESLQSIEWIGIIFMMAGTYLLEKRPGQKIVQPLKMVFGARNHSYIFFAVGLFAVSSIIDKMLLTGFHADPRIILFYQHIVYCAIFGSMLLYRRFPLLVVVQKPHKEISLIIIVALITIAYRFTQLEATKMAPVALVLAIKRTSILYASFFGGKIFSEKRLGLKLAGASLIVGAGFIILRNVA